MDDILKLAKDYSKERHLDLLPRCNNNILDKLDYIYDENWENQGVPYPYIGHLFKHFNTARVAAITLPSDDRSFVDTQTLCQFVLC